MKNEVVKSEKCLAKMTKCHFHAKILTFFPLSQTNWGNAPVLKLDFWTISYSKPKKNIYIYIIIIIIINSGTRAQ